MSASTSTRSLASSRSKGSSPSRNHSRACSPPSARRARTSGPARAPGSGTPSARCSRTWTAAPRRLWAKDSTLWTSDPGKREEVRDRLGWLNVAEKMLEHASEFRALATDGRVYSDVVLLGMGGSSLCPDVLRNTFGPVRGHPRLHVLDTTDPATILSVRQRIRIQDTLFIVASKSGETTETLSH